METLIQAIEAIAFATDYKDDDVPVVTLDDVWPPKAEELEVTDYDLDGE